MAKSKSSDDVNWDSAIEKLIALTKDGELRWESNSDFRARGDDEISGVAFEAEVKGRRILVYEYQYRHYTDVDEWDWATSIAIEFVDAHDNLEYSWQGRLGNRRQLLDAIRFQAANISDFLEEFLHE